MQVLPLHSILYILLYFASVYRLQLSALHFNENSNREKAMTKEGEYCYDIIYPKYKKGGYVVKQVVKHPTYGKYSMLLKLSNNLIGMFFYN